MATPNGKGGWDLSDEDVAEVLAASYPDDEEDLDEKNKNYRIDHKARVLKFAWRHREFIKDVDGHWYWMPTRPRGLFSAAHVKVLGELLDEANRKYEEEVKAYFDNDRRERGEHREGDIWVIKRIGFRLMYVGNGRWINQFGSVQPLPDDAESLYVK